MERRVVGELRFWSAPPVQTSDVDEAREVLEAAYLPLEVNPVGRDPLDMRMNALQLPLLTAGYIHFGGEVKLRAPDVRSYHIDIPLSGHAINSWDDASSRSRPPAYPRGYSCLAYPRILHGPRGATRSA
jgi:hypothetical protein